MSPPPAEPGDLEQQQSDEHSHLLPNNRLLNGAHYDRRDSQSIISSHVSKDELALAAHPVGERLPYNDYTTIDWLHDLVKDSFRFRAIHSLPGIRGRFYGALDASEGWFACALIGILTAIVAFAVDVAVATVSDWKIGYCTTSPFANREFCCTDRDPLLTFSTSTVWTTLARNISSGSGADIGAWAEGGELGEDCAHWHTWSSSYGGAYGIYLGFALLFGIISASVTLLTKKSLPAASPGQGDKYVDPSQPGASIGGGQGITAGKSMYMAAGSGIPEIKTILSGFVIPHYLDFKVLAVKAVGAVFAVSTGMCLGKEGPFVHIATCMAYLVGMRIPKYRDNGRKMRELLSAGCAAGLSVAFGAPIGGVLFSYEEISTHFPRKVLWRAFLCSLFAAMVLRALNPSGTGKLVLFETSYGTSYQPVHYLIFIVLGIAGGIFGGLFCKLNFLWSKTFRKYDIIKNHPVFEVFLVVLVTALVQYPNPMTREPGDVIIKNLLVDCRGGGGQNENWICVQEATDGLNGKYVGWLVYGTLAKLVLTIITFGCKVPSGIIIPALDAGAFFGRLIGQWITTISPGIFAMVGAAGFLAGVSRMTISLGVIMFELTGELEYIVPHMIAILVAKWVADAIEREGVYDLAQTVLGHPFLDLDHSMSIVQKENALVETLIPPSQTMSEITVHVPPTGFILRKVLGEKLDQLQRRGLMDAGLVLIDEKGMLQGYLSEGELEFGLNELSQESSSSSLGKGNVERVRLLGRAEDGELDLSVFVDRSPLTLSEKAPMEYAVEMFGKLGLRYLCVLEEGSGRLVGVIIKKRLVVYLEGLKDS
ncbi:hypothetical protein MMC25_006100 [Agyrium rufum]|nr:hypothetical protein [Agyrium rufum]